MKTIFLRLSKRKIGFVHIVNGKRIKKYLHDYLVFYFHDGDAHSTKNHVYHLSAEIRNSCVNSPLHLGTGSRSIH